MKNIKLHKINEGTIATGRLRKITPEIFKQNLWVMGVKWKMHGVQTFCPAAAYSCSCHDHFPKILFRFWCHPMLSSTLSYMQPLLADEESNLLAGSVCGCRQIWCSGNSYSTRWLSDTRPYITLVLSLKANLVAAFEQSLSLMTERLQTLSVSSEQKVQFIILHNNGN